MVKPIIDMTGWVMAEHGFPESKLIVIKQVEDGITISGHREAQWLCKCACQKCDDVILSGVTLRKGQIMSGGCETKPRKTCRYKENRYDTSGDCGIIWSTNTNEIGYFDLVDLDKLLEHSWYISKHGYFTARIQGKETKMHVFLGYKYHDHINQNKKDNRSENLRPCTHQQNDWNRPRAKNNTSGYIGVCWNKKTQKWFSRITVDGDVKQLGRFANKDDAIRARLEAEAKYFKEFAPQRHLFEQYGIQEQFS